MNKLIDQLVQDGTLSVANESPQVIYRVDAKSLHQVCQQLYTNPATYFDMLSCITGVDNGVQDNTIDVVYQLYSITLNISLTLKVTLPRQQPEVESITDIWRSANWMEREVFDMLGVRFLNHPDLRKILLPNDWEGYPLRKDYEVQKTYRGMEVDKQSSHQLE